MFSPGAEHRRKDPRVRVRVRIGVRVRDAVSIRVRTFAMADRNHSAQQGPQTTMYKSVHFSDDAIHQKLQKVARKLWCIIQSGQLIVLNLNRALETSKNAKVSGLFSGESTELLPKSQDFFQANQQSYCTEGPKIPFCGQIITNTP